MKVKKTENDIELIMKPGERDKIDIINKKIESQTSVDIELVNKIFENLIYSNSPEKPTVVAEGLLGSLKLILGIPTSEFLINVILNFSDSDQVLEKLKQDHLISQKSFNFFREISVKYGYSIKRIYERTELRDHWININTNTIIIHKSPMLRTEIMLGNGNLLTFNSDLNDSIIFAEHFLESMISTINEVDKELIMDINEKNIEKLSEKIDELKKKRQETQQKIKKIENSTD